MSAPGAFSTTPAWRHGGGRGRGERPAQLGVQHRAVRRAAGAVVLGGGDVADAIVAEGYRFQSGRYSVPDAPGLGIRIDEKVYTEKYKAAERVIA